MTAIQRDLIVALAAFAAVFGIAYVIIMTRYRERMAMMEKGVDTAGPSQRFNRLLALKTGMFLVGLAIGILVADFFKTHEILSRQVAYASMVTLFGGLSLILNHFIDKKTK